MSKKMEKVSTVEVRCVEITCDCCGEKADHDNQFMQRVGVGSWPISFTDVCPTCIWWLDTQIQAGTLRRTP